MCYELPIEPQEEDVKALECEACGQDFWEGLEYGGSLFCDEICFVSHMKDRHHLRPCDYTEDWS